MLLPPSLRRCNALLTMYLGTAQAALCSLQLKYL